MECNVRSLNQTKPTLVLPCCLDKAENATTAITMYQGKGYMGIVKQWDLQLIQEAFNVLFMSAEYGLIYAGRWIAPYDRKLNKERMKELASDAAFKRKAKFVLSACNPASPCYVVLPKLYREALEGLVGTQLSKFRDCQFSSGGIGRQRGFLKQVLTLEIARYNQKASVPSVDLYHVVTDKGNRSIRVKLSVGDTITPWIGGVGAEAKFSVPKVIRDIKTRSTGVIGIIDDAGVEWSSFDVLAGFPREVKAHLDDALACRMKQVDTPIVSLKKRQAKLSLEESRDHETYR